MTTGSPAQPRASPNGRRRKRKRACRPPPKHATRKSAWVPRPAPLHCGTRPTTWPSRSTTAHASMTCLPPVLHRLLEDITGAWTKNAGPAPAWWSPPTAATADLPVRGRGRPRRRRRFRPARGRGAMGRRPRSHPGCTRRAGVDPGDRPDSSRPTKGPRHPFFISNTAV